MENRDRTEGCDGWTMGRWGARRRQRHKQAAQLKNYMEVMSLRAWSNSSLMALYFNFCAYSSSVQRGQRVKGDIFVLKNRKMCIKKGEWGKEMMYANSMMKPEQDFSCRQYSGKYRSFKQSGWILPSRSSMVFSSLATDLSANSARVSA